MLILEKSPLPPNLVSAASRLISGESNTSSDSQESGFTDTQRNQLNQQALMQLLSNAKLPMQLLPKLPAVQPPITTTLNISKILQNQEYSSQPLQQDNCSSPDYGKRKSEELDVEQVSPNSVKMAKLE